jgi:hypothetical protein
MLLTLGGCSKDDKQFVEKCKVGEYIRSSEFVLVNDVDYYPHLGHTQCIFENQREGSFGWIWEEISPPPGQSRTGTDAYVIYGDSSSLLEGVGNTTSALPIDVADLASLTIEYDLSVATTSRYRLGFSTGNAYPYTVGQSYSATLRIDLYSDRAGDSAYFQKRIAIDGKEYDFYRDIDYGNYGFTYWFVMARPASGTLRFHSFLDFLADEGYGEGLGIYRITYIDLFQHMWDGGSGRTDINTLSIDVTPNVE